MKIDMNPAAEEDILRNALEAIQRAAGINTVRRPGGVVLMRRGKAEWRFGTEVRQRLTRENIGTIAGRVADRREGLLLVTRHLPAGLASHLRELGLAFIDAAGNAFIDEPGLFVFITGNRPEERDPGTDVRRLLRPAGLRVIFTLLCQAELERGTYREIAAAAGVALGTINHTVRDLIAMGFMADLGDRGRYLTRKDALLEQWVVAYPQQLRPRQFIGTYAADGNEWWRDTDLTLFDAQWGGEPAAAVLTGHLKPARITIYAGDGIPELILRNRLRKDPRGDIEIIRRFWTFEPEKARKDVVHPLLVYADLLATANPRNIETANILYDRELAGLVGEG
jgi:hypothetical protein